jgi:hypothetical protein
MHESYETPALRQTFASLVKKAGGGAAVVMVIKEMTGRNMSEGTLTKIKSGDMRFDWELSFILEWWGNTRCAPTWTPGDKPHVERATCRSLPRPPCAKSEKCRLRSFTGSQLAILNSFSKKARKAWLRFKIC